MHLLKAWVENLTLEQMLDKKHVALNNLSALWC